MAIRLRTIVIFVFLIAFIYFVLRFFSVYWLLVLFNVILLFGNFVFLVTYFSMPNKVSKPLPKDFPFVSIIVPNYNGSRTLVKCIESLKALRYSGKKEIIVVDDGSVDNSLQLLRKIKGIKVIAKKNNSGKAAALNTGLKVAKGEIVATIDSDTFPAPDALEKMVALFDSKDVGAVTGLVRVSNKNGFLQYLQEIEYLVAFAFFQSVFSELNSMFFTSGSISIYRKSVLVKVGGFDENNISEDMEIAMRLRYYNYRIVACIDAQIFTEVPDSFSKLFKQRLRWYRGKFFNSAKYSQMIFNPKFGDFGVFVFPFSIMVELLAILIFVVIFASNIDNLFNYFSFLFSWLGFGGSLFGVIPSLSGLHSSFFLYFLTLLFYSFVVYIAHKIVKNHDFSVSKVPHVFFFLFLYSFFISLVYLVSFFKEVNRSDYKW
ncbi:MAG: glycosyltransferase [Candidatus Diapherotrites archaeon]